VSNAFVHRKKASFLSGSLAARRLFFTFTSVGLKLISFYLFSLDKTHEFRRLAMGRLLDDLQRKMTYKADHGVRDPLKLLVHTTHVRHTIATSIHVLTGAFV
jgi:hypothetical protein